MPTLGNEKNRANVAKRSAWGRIWGGMKWVAASPLESFPRDQIVKNAHLIRSLAGVVFGGYQGDGRLRTGDDRDFDLDATAFNYGISVYDLEVLLARRQRSTARAAYLAFGIGWLFFLAWLANAASMPWTVGRLLPVLEFVPFCLMFFLTAFGAALRNFQIRTRRLATAGEYLRTEGSFWPR